jgi:subtilisin family serine protease
MQCQPLAYKSLEKDMTASKFISLIFVILAIQNVSAQVGKVWATVNHTSILPVQNETILESSNADLNNAIQSLNIVSFKRALPNSKKENLQKVYEITCACDKNDLYTHLVNEVSEVTNVVFAPEYETLALPNDYHASFTNDYALDLINAAGAWEITKGNNNFIIAISDQNFFPNHEELANKVVYYDSTNNLFKEHGTAVAILAAGNTNNSIGKSSIGYNSKLAFYEMNYNELLVASYSGSKVINISWTSGCEYNHYANEVINEVYNNGTFIVAAAGNGTTCGGPENLVYPASFENVFAVTSIGPHDNHERTIGNAATTHQHNITVDLSAPGYDVAISGTSGIYSTGTGTSYAAPQVTGTVALMLAQNPCLTNEEIESILKSSSVDVNNINVNYFGKIGSGRLNAASAVAMAKNFTATITNVSCFNGNNGAIDLNTNSENFVSFNWTNGLHSEDLSNLNSGTYKVEVEYIGGCKLWESFTVSQPDSISISAQITEPSNDSFGSISLNITGGTPDYTINWNNSETTEALFNLENGSYEVTISDNNGCQKSETFELINSIQNNNVGLNETDELIINLYPNPCNGMSQLNWNNEQFENLSLINESGEILLNESVRFSNKFNFEGLKPGIYFIQMSTIHSEMSNLKLVVQ